MVAPRTLFASLALLPLIAPASALAQPRNLDPEDTRVVVPDLVDVPVAPPVAEAPAPAWTLDQARALRAEIDRVAYVGLTPADYRPEALDGAIALGGGEALNRTATDIFALLATHLRDGRTPNSARRQWFVTDTDTAERPVAALLADALAGDVAATLASLEPVHPAYHALKAELAKVTARDMDRVNLLRVNLERWRWMPRDLGDHYIMTNVPQFETRVIEQGRVLATHKAVVGKVSTATPQLEAKATAIILNPNWTLPRSIINEGIGATIANNPARARAQGYTWTGSGPNLSVVQKPGPGNALGQMKLEMLNEHAIYLHDTPSKAAFAADVRAFSHGCIRTERALHFSGLMAVRYGGRTPEEFGEAIASGKTTRIAFEKPFPVYIAYWTAMPGADGKLLQFKDLYERDKPVVDAFARPGRMAEPAVARPATMTPVATPPDDAAPTTS